MSGQSEYEDSLELWSATIDGKGNWMVPDRFTNRGGAANEINGKDFKSGELEDSYQKGQEEQSVECQIK